MGSLYRSEDMSLVNIYLQSEAAFQCVSELGEIGKIQFKDLNASVNSFQRKFVSEVRRCDEMERKLRFLEKELKKDEILEDYQRNLNPQAPGIKEMNELEAKLEKFETDMKEVNKNQEKLKKNFLELTELKHILRKAQIFFDEASSAMNDPQQSSQQVDEDSIGLLSNDYSLHTINTLSFVAGVIQSERMTTFERVLWRACRGNVFLRFAEIEAAFDDLETGNKVRKNVFVIFFQGDQLKQRVKNICEGFHASIYPCPETAQERREIAIGVMTRLDDLQTVLNRTEEHRRIILSQVAADIKKWFIMVGKMKAIYHTLNKFNVNMADKCLIGEGWCANKDIDDIRYTIRRATELTGSSVPSILQTLKTKETPPTYHNTDVFTQSFQTIIDAYGVANYKEINPAPFTIITFPFLFAVMFGDLGHGLIMFIFGAYLLWKEKQFMLEKSNNEIWEMVFGGRYLIFMMGLFSMYTGFLYNECFSISINLFGSAWNVSNIDNLDSLLKTTDEIELDPYNDEGVYRSFKDNPYPKGAGVPYLYGMDPIWQTAENKITFQNSYKMKSSIVFGMAQMLFGLILSYKNHRYSNDRLSLYTEWIPQMIFLWCIVGYLCFLIILKWTTVRNPNEAPSLLIGLINMFMFQAAGTELFTGQVKLQYFIVIMAGLCVPWMLLAKPYILYKRHQQKKQGGGAQYHAVSVNVDDDESFNLLRGNDNMSTASDDSVDSATIDKEEFNLGELMIYQIIHTIEYCLSCISHTASYLRLWALSLAHAELSEVLWKMVMHIGFTSFPSTLMGGIMTFAIFSFFATLTVTILLLMEGLSAFLHALRLHWVEFQDKFYKGQGVIFQPFSFQSIFTELSDS